VETCAELFRTPVRAVGAVKRAWQRRTRGEPRWQVAASTAVAIGLQVAVPGRLAVLRPVWILPALEGILLVALLIANPHRIDRESRVLRMLGLTPAALISFGNAWSVAGLATGLVRGTERENARPLLVTGGAIWLTEDHMSPADRAAAGSYVGCIAGALSRREYLDGLTAAGFAGASVTFTTEAAPGLHSAIIRAVKPAAG